MLKKICLLCLVSNSAFAACDPSVSSHFPSKTAANSYGNSRTDRFNCAVTGTNELSEAQLRERANLLPESLTDRWYIRLGGNAAAEGVSGTKTGGNDLQTASAIVKTKDEKTASNNIEVGFGYVWKGFAMDVEWLGLKSVAYASTLENITPNLDFTTTVKGDALLANLYWIAQDIYSVQLYGLMAAGFTSNKSTAVLAGGDPVTLSKYSLSFGAGIGGRFNIIDKLYGDMAFRYLMLGRVKYVGRNPGGGISMELKSTRNWLGVSFRLLYLF